jgi:hypothetical protein
MKSTACDVQEAGWGSPYKDISAVNIQEPRQQVQENIAILDFQDD